MYGQDIKWKRELLTVDNATLVNSFTCGIDYLNFGEYLYDIALDDQDARTYVYIDVEKNKIFAYAALSCTVLMFEDSGSNADYSPAILIDKFIVDEDYRGMPFSDSESDTLSQAILADVIDTAEQISKTVIGAKYIVLYSTKRAHQFYKNCGIKDFDEESMTPTTNQADKDDCKPMYWLI